MSPDTIFVEFIDRLAGTATRRVTFSQHNGLLRFIRFYLLDMCWGYALVFSLHAILGNNTANIKWIFIIAFIFSASMEFLQMTPFVNGTFDVFDILCEALAEGIAVFIIKYAHEEAVL